MRAEECKAPVATLGVAKAKVEIGNESLKDFVQFVVIAYLLLYDPISYISLSIFFTVSTLSSPRKCNNVVILSLIIFCLNWNQHVNSHKYKVF